MSLFEVTSRAARSCWRRPTVCATALLTLAAGIGLTSSLFAVLTAVLWRPWPIPDPDRVVWVETLAAGVPDGASPGLFLAWQERVGMLQAVPRSAKPTRRSTTRRESIGSGAHT
jgi:hypothetical protein